VGVIADLVPGGGITRVDARDVRGIRDAIHGLYVDFSRGTLPQRSPSGLQVDQFSPELIAKRFLELLRELILAKKQRKLERA
jgi:hypothetical protein